MSLVKRLNAAARVCAGVAVSAAMVAPTSAFALAVVQGDFSTAADLPFCCDRAGARTTSVIGAAIGGGVELQNQGLTNPSGWQGGQVWMDLNPTTSVLTLTAKDALDFQTFSARLANLQFDTAGAFVRSVSMLSNGLVTGGLVPQLAFTSNSVSVDYSTVSAFNFVANGSASFLLDIGVDSPPAMAAFSVPMPLGMPFGMPMGYPMPMGSPMPMAFSSFSAAPVAPIPEPSTYALMALGLAAVGFAARKKRAATAAAPAA
jgi:hypothetical protein